MKKLIISALTLAAISGVARANDAVSEQQNPFSLAMTTDQGLNWDTIDERPVNSERSNANTARIDARSEKLNAQVQQGLADKIEQRLNGRMK